MERTLIADICPRTPKKVRGKILRQMARVEVDEWVPANTVICAGSVVDLTEDQVAELERFGALGDGHFEMEQVLLGTGQLFGQALPLADILRSYGVHTLEQVRDNVAAHEPLKGDPIPVQDVLRLYGNEAQVQAWLGAIKSVCDPVEGKE